jgi:hypothetical protein
VTAQFVSNPISAGGATAVIINASSSARIVTSQQVQIIGTEGTAQRQGVFWLSVTKPQTTCGDNARVDNGPSSESQPIGCDPGCPGCPPSPIVIDVNGDGFDLTGAADGVRFDLNADGVKERLAWTPISWAQTKGSDTTDEGCAERCSATDLRAPSVGLAGPCREQKCR